VHAWLPRGPADLDGDADDTDDGPERRVLDAALAAWPSRFSDVPVQAKLVRGQPARALIAESAGAALTVVGSRDRSTVGGLVLGPVSRRVLQHTHSPVALLGPRR